MIDQHPLNESLLPPLTANIAIPTQPNTCMKESYFAFWEGGGGISGHYALSASHQFPWSPTPTIIKCVMFGSLLQFWPLSRYYSMSFTRAVLYCITISLQSMSLGCLSVPGPFNHLKSSLLGSTSESNINKYSTINKIPLIALNFAERNNENKAHSPPSSENTIIAPKVKDRTHNVTEKVTQVRQLAVWKAHLTLFFVQLSCHIMRTGHKMRHLPNECQTHCCLYYSLCLH